MRSARLATVVATLCLAAAASAQTPNFAGKWTLVPDPAATGGMGGGLGQEATITQDGVLLPGVAQVAMQQGDQAGRNIRRAIEGQPLEPFRYKDYGIMATIGRGSAVGDVFGLKISGFFAWIFWIFLHIFWLIGFRNRFVVMTEWAWAYFSLQRRVRLITGDRRDE